MARGGKIVVTADPRGKFEWGYLAGAYKPGTVLQVDPTVALKNGKHTWKVATPGADGGLPIGPLGVLDMNLEQGVPATTAYASGDFAKIYIPESGDEMNILFGDTAGTADDIALGDALIVKNATGKVIKTTGSPATKVAVAMEAIVDPVADQLIWVGWSVG